MNSLEEIGKCLRQILQDQADIKSQLEIIKPAPAMPETYINSLEAQRILDVSAPVLLDYIRIGLVSKHENKNAPTNKFLASEIHWISKQRYKRLSGHEIKKLIARKDQELIRAGVYS
ncbi:MAG: hypothetical protein J7619_23030 [Dyadobacter sp.]|uniref:hypothetical protein n=1 Tax=Dyadobacter sp. TaxID=1914288 RepID=UPI001B200CE6|nr:hypothetical protein [Dyadobacter sp.]MBO9615589.1 hypothetical protein [Dyadobacter sp.]